LPATQALATASTALRASPPLLPPAVSLGPPLLPPAVSLGPILVPSEVHVEGDAIVVRVHLCEPLEITAIHVHADVSMVLEVWATATAATPETGTCLRSDFGRAFVCAPIWLHAPVESTRLAVDRDGSLVTITFAARPRGPQQLIR
jgi:hypothetical protein